MANAFYQNAGNIFRGFQKRPKNQNLRAEVRKSVARDPKIMNQGMARAGGFKPQLQNPLRENKNPGNNLDAGMPYGDFTFSTRLKFWGDQEGFRIRNFASPSPLIELHGSPELPALSLSDFRLPSTAFSDLRGSAMTVEPASIVDATPTLNQPASLAACLEGGSSATLAVENVLAKESSVPRVLESVEEMDEQNLSSEASLATSMPPEAKCALEDAGGFFSNYVESEKQVASNGTVPPNVSTPLVKGGQSSPTKKGSSNTSVSERGVTPQESLRENLSDFSSAESGESLTLEATTNLALRRTASLCMAVQKIKTPTIIGAERDFFKLVRNKEHSEITALRENYGAQKV